jgi:hypothetical protein
VISRTSASFRKLFGQLPTDVKRQARQAYRLFLRDPYHPGLRFKSVHPREPIYSVRVGLHYRAVGVRNGNEIVWFWIGAHGEYDRLLQKRGHKA